MLTTLLEIVFLAALVSGVYLLAGLGAALVSGGALGVLACEWHSR